MMLQRLLIALGLLGLGTIVFVLFNWYQRRQATWARGNEEDRGTTHDNQSLRGTVTASREAEAQNGGPRILYFRSDHCPACDTQARLLAQLDASERELVEKIDVDEAQVRARAYNIMTTPTLIVLNADGEAEHINYGVVAPKKLRRQLSDAQVPAQ